MLIRACARKHPTIIRNALSETLPKLHFSERGKKKPPDVGQTLFRDLDLFSTTKRIVVVEVAGRVEKLLNVSAKRNRASRRFHRDKYFLRLKKKKETPKNVLHYPVSSFFSPLVSLSPVIYTRLSRFKAGQQRWKRFLLIAKQTDADRDRERGTNVKLRVFYGSPRGCNNDDTSFVIIILFFELPERLLLSNVGTRTTELINSAR